MGNDKKRLIVAVTGASGAIYAKTLIDLLNTHRNQLEEAGVIFSKTARQVWKYELRDESYLSLPFRVYDPDDFYAPFASGSSGFDHMIICPCSMGTLGRIANGISNNLISRAADVVLKEKGKLILLTREAPYNLIHLKNMQTVMEAGAVVFPASPSFYSRPGTIDDIALEIVKRVLKIAGFEVDLNQWGKEHAKS